MVFPQCVDANGDFKAQLGMHVVLLFPLSAHKPAPKNKSEIKNEIVGREDWEVMAWDIPDRQTALDLCEMKRGQYNNFAVHVYDSNGAVSAPR